MKNPSMSSSGTTSFYINAKTGSRAVACPRICNFASFNKNIVAPCDRQIISSGAPDFTIGYLNTGTAPRFGIDIEGYSEGNIVYEEPVNVIIRNNVLKGNVNNAISNFNGTSVIIEGNIADGTISYGYGTSTTIANNIIKKNPESTGQSIGINGLGVGALEARSDAVIKGNLI